MEHREDRIQRSEAECLYRLPSGRPSHLPQRKICPNYPSHPYLHDPDLNPGYAELAAHYRTAVVPARAGHAKDKAVVEGLVKILMCYVRFRHRRQRFTSPPQINIALRECVERINSRAHSRFGVSRRDRFASVEKTALKPLPAVQFDVGEWREAKLHPDCYIQLERVYY